MRILLNRVIMIILAGSYKESVELSMEKIFKLFARYHCMEYYDWKIYLFKTYSSEYLAVY